MKDMDIQGIIRGKPHRTTIPDKKGPCPLDYVNRQVPVLAPKMLRVSDFTRIANWKDFIYVAFVIDAFCPQDRRLARRHLGACPFRPRCLPRQGASMADTPGDRRHPGVGRGCSRGVG